MCTYFADSVQIPKQKQHSTNASMKNVLLVPRNYDNQVSAHLGQKNEPRTVIFGSLLGLVIGFLGIPQETNGI